MHWKIPLLLLGLFLLGFTNCQDGTTAGSVDDLSVEASPTAEAGSEADAGTPGAEEGPEVGDAEPTEAEAAAVEEPSSDEVPTLGPEAGAEGAVESVATSAGDDAAVEQTTEAAADGGADTDPATLPNIEIEQERPASPRPTEEVTDGDTGVGETTETAAEPGAPDGGQTGDVTTASAAESAAETTAAKAAEESETEAAAAKEETTAVTEGAVGPTLPGPGGEHEGPATGVPLPTTVEDEEETTEAVTTEEVITTTAAPETTTTPWTGEPCETPHKLSEVERHFTATVGNEPVNDRSLESTWWQVEYDGVPGIITSQPIKPEQCGTEVPYHLNLKGQDLPRKDSNGTYEICSSVNSDYGLIRCAEAQKITVHNCGDKYVYHLSPLIWKASLTAKAGICVQKPGEIVPLHFLAISQEESDRLDVPATSVDDCSKEQLDGIVTVELKYPTDLGEKKSDTDVIRELDKVYRPMVARALNGLPKPTEAPVKEEPTTAAPEIVEKEKGENVDAQPAESADPGDSQPDAPAPEGEVPDVPDNMDTDADLKGPRAAPLVANPRFLYKRDLSRTKRSTDHEYKEDDVHYVGPTPRIKHGILQKSVYVDDPETTAVDADSLFAAIKGLNKTGELGKELGGLPVVKIYKGLPKDIKPLVAPIASQSTWKKHEGVFITIIVLLLLLLLILLIGCCCIKCRNRRGSWTANERPKGKGKKGKPSPKKPILAHESPYDDDEIKRDEANMTENENPAYTANGSGGHLTKPSKDDDLGYIVPFEEFNRAERMRPDVLDTKL